MLNLSRVTLMFVETRAHAITKRVIDDCLTKANFKDVLIYSDQPERIPVAGARYEIVPDFPNKREAGLFYYAEAMAKVETDFALMMEWDAGIIEPANWRPEFFNYDYIGAPWNTADDLKVGNGGFALMSKRLGHHLCEQRGTYQVCTDWDVCRNNRRRLEREGGFTWAPYDLAADFSWELAPRSPNTFGFHGAFHWHATLERDELVTRAKLLTETPYLLSKMRDVFRYNTVDWLEAELGTELWAKYRGYHPVPPVRNVQYRNLATSQQRANVSRLLAERQSTILALRSKGLKA